MSSSGPGQSLGDVFGDGSGLVTQLGDMIRRDGLQDLLGGFNEAGAEDAVESWVGTGPNRPTDAGQVESAVGRTRTEAMASALGVAPDTLAAGLARLIPAVVDHLTPGARLPSGADLDAMDLSGIDAAALLG